MPRGRDRLPFRSTATRCAWCGIMAGNATGIPVYRYRLQRTQYREGLQRSVSMGAIGLCDPCIESVAEAPRDYAGRNGSRKHRHPRLDGGLDEWHLHAAFRAHHAHPSLGPELGTEAEPTPIRRKA